MWSRVLKGQRNRTEVTSRWDELGDCTVHLERRRKLITTVLTTVTISSNRACVCVCVCVCVCGGGGGGGNWDCMHILCVVSIATGL